MPMTIIGGLQALRTDLLLNTCLITGKRDSLRPAILMLEDETGRPMEEHGMVHRSVRAGRRDSSGRKVISVVRKDVKIALCKNGRGISFVRCSKGA